MLNRYGFNPGSQLAIVNGNSLAVANAAVTTTLAPAAAGLSALFCSSFVKRGLAGERLQDRNPRSLKSQAVMHGIAVACLHHFTDLQALKLSAGWQAA